MCEDVLASMLPAALREPQCPNTSWSAPTASVFNDVHTLLHNIIHHKDLGPFTVGPKMDASAQTAIRLAKLDSVVIFGHSFGAATAAAMVQGRPCLHRIGRLTMSCLLSASHFTALVWACFLLGSLTVSPLHKLCLAQVVMLHIHNLSCDGAVNMVLCTVHSSIGPQSAFSAQMYHQHNSGRICTCAPAGTAAFV